MHPAGSVFYTRISMPEAIFGIVLLSAASVLLFIYKTSKHSTDIEVHHFDQGLLKINEDANDVWKARNGLLMTCQLHGRIGNMMFAYASLVGIAHRNGRTPALPEAHFLRAYFRLRAANMPRRIGRHKELIEQRSAVYDERTELIQADEDLIALIGYFQSWKYFARVVDEVRREFAFHADLAKFAVNFLNGAISSKFSDGISRRDVILVGIHVRVRDMASNISMSQGYTIATPSYLSAAMDFFKHEFKKEKLMFVLSTDDTEWVDRNFPFPVDTPLIRTSKGQDVNDLAVLSYCNHSIITVGTFGWWAGWLANGRTVYYKNFPRPLSSLDALYRHEDYYPSEWIAL